MIANAASSSLERVKFPVTPNFLVVEDSEVDFEILHRTLGRAYGGDFNIEWVDNVDAAKTAAGDDAFHFYLVDRNLSVDDGLSFVHWARENKTSGIPILMSGHVDERLHDSACAVGAAFSMDKDQMAPDRLQTTLRYVWLADQRERQLQRQSLILDWQTRELSILTNELKATQAELKIALAHSKGETEWFRELSNTDPVTGLLNRRAFQDELERSLQESRRCGAGVGLLLMDLDGFKLVNDTFGHDMGDKLLRAFGERLNNGLRSADMVCRVGGDEFGVVVKCVSNLSGVERVRQRVRELIASPFVFGDVSLTMRASCGCAFNAPTDGLDSNEMFALADQDLYARKPKKGPGDRDGVANPLRAAE